MKIGNRNRPMEASVMGWDADARFGQDVRMGMAERNSAQETGNLVFTPILHWTHAFMETGGVKFQWRVGIMPIPVLLLIFHVKGLICRVSCGVGTRPRLV
jgi:hypothetical protein